MRSSLLEHIASINWNDKSFPDVPVWLNDLLSDKETKQTVAYENLKERVIQGDVSEVNFDLGYHIEQVLRTDAPDVITPILIEMLNESDLPETGLINVLGLLCRQVMYVEFRFSNEQFKRRASAIYEKIWDARNVYIPFLQHRNSMIRRIMAFFLCQFRDKEDTVIPIMLDATTMEKDSITVMWHLERFTRTLLKGQEINIKYRDAYLKTLNSLLNSPLGFPVHFVAAFHIIEQLGNETPDAILDRFVSGMIIEFDHETIQNILAARIETQSKLLMTLHPIKAINLALQVLTQTTIVPNALYAVIVALNMACEPPSTEAEGFLSYPVAREGRIFYRYFVNRFKTPCKFDLSSLSPKQKQVLKAIVETDLIWTVDVDLFDIFGLPEQRKKLKQLTSH